MSSFLCSSVINPTFAPVIIFPKMLIIISERMGGYTTVVVDALPYIDHGYDEPGVR